jgi:hypothetical protein
MRRLSRRAASPGIGHGSSPPAAPGPCLVAAWSAPAITLASRSRAATSSSSAADAPVAGAGSSRDQPAEHAFAPRARAPGRRASLGVTTIFQVIGYTLLDFDDAYQLTEVGTFSARYAYLATWDIDALLDEPAGQHVSLPSVRHEFRELLLTQL